MLKGQYAAMCATARAIAAGLPIGVTISMALGIALGGLADPRSALAQQSAPLTVDVADCVKLERPEDRLACFENQVAEAEQARRPAEPTGSPVEPAARSAGQPAAAQSEPRTRRRESSEAPASGERAASTAVEVSRQPATSNERAATGERARASASAAVPPIAAERRSEPSESQEFAGTIAELQETIPDSYLITLENGQVWRQMRPKRYPLQPGYEVRIYSSRWGNSYRLSSPILNGFIQVERVR